MNKSKKDPGPFRKAFNKYVDGTASYIKGEQGFVPDAFTGGKPTKQAMATIMRKTAELIDPRNKAAASGSNKSTKTTNSMRLPSMIKAYPSKKAGKLKRVHTGIKSTGIKSTSKRLGVKGVELAKAKCIKNISEKL